MELTINIKDPNSIAAFLNMIKEIDYLEIVDVKEDNGELPEEHRKLLDERLKRAERGETTYKSWESIKKKYEGRNV